MVRELRNKRATKIVPPVETAETTSDEPAKRTNAKHNSGMDTKIENFGYLIDFLKTIEAYHPNEQDLTIESLEEKLQTLKQTHTACIVAEAAAMAARLQRHILLYKDKTGLVPVGLDVKLYVKSAYGATSPEYKSISGIPFVRIE